jgi:hypothetical protein
VVFDRASEEEDEDGFYLAVIGTCDLKSIFAQLGSKSKGGKKSLR